MKCSGLLLTAIPSGDPIETSLDIPTAYQVIASHCELRWIVGQFRSVAASLPRQMAS